MFDNKDANSDITLIDFGLSTRYIKSPGHDKLADKVGTMYSMSPQVLEGAYTEKVCTVLWRPNWDAFPRYAANIMLLPFV